MDEILGKAKSGKPGCGRICKEKQSLVEKPEKEVNRLEQKIKALEQTIASSQKEENELRKSFISERNELHYSEENEINALKQDRKNYDGLAARLEALGELTTKNDTLWFAYLFITLLFFTIETAPIFVKLISSKGLYDRY
jgi:chromosome segregation ATPase